MGEKNYLKAQVKLRDMDVSLPASLKGSWEGKKNGQHVEWNCENRANYAIRGAYKALSVSLEISLTNRV